MRLSDRGTSSITCSFISLAIVSIGTLIGLSSASGQYLVRNFSASSSNWSREIIGTNSPDRRSLSDSSCGSQLSTDMIRNPLISMPRVAWQWILSQRSLKHPLREADGISTSHDAITSKAITPSSGCSMWITFSISISTTENLLVSPKYSSWI